MNFREARLYLRSNLRINLYSRTNCPEFLVPRKTGAASLTNPIRESRKRKLIHDTERLPHILKLLCQILSFAVPKSLHCDNSQRHRIISSRSELLTSSLQQCILNEENITPCCQFFLFLFSYFSFHYSIHITFSYKLVISSFDCFCDNNREVASG